MKRIIRIKVYIDRARSYLTYGTMLALVTLILQNVHVRVTMPMVAIGGLLLLAILAVAGWFDTHFGFFSAEAQRHSELNPVYVDMLERLTRIEAKQEDIIYALHEEDEEWSICKRLTRIEGHFTPVYSDEVEKIRQGATFVRPFEESQDMSDIDFDKLPLRSGPVKVHTVDPQWTPEFAAAVMNGKVEGSRSAGAINTRIDPEY